MPGNQKTSKRRNGRRPRRGRNRNGQFSSSSAPGDSNRKSPTWPTMLGPRQMAASRPPVLPSTVRQKGQLYYESGLGLTAPTSGNVVTYFFSANGMFDPNITGTGHQPIGFDQMMLLYEQTTVVRSSIEVTFNIGPGLSVQCGVALFPDASGLTNPSQLVENGLIRMVPLTSGSSTFQNQRMRTTVRLDCDVAKYFGRPSYQSMLNDDNLYSTAAANPVEQVYYGVVAWQISPDGTTTTSVGFDVILSFDTIYWEPRKLGLSLEEKKAPDLHPRLPLRKGRFADVCAPEVVHVDSQGVCIDPSFAERFAAMEREVDSLFSKR